MDPTVAKERAQAKDGVDAMEASGAGPGPANGRAFKARNGIGHSRPAQTARNDINSPLMARGTRPKRQRRMASTAAEKTGRRSAAARWGRVGHKKARADACVDRSIVWTWNGSPGPRLSVYVTPPVAICTFSCPHERVRT
jgi:hypothetical protein